MKSIHPDEFDRVGKALVDGMGITPEEAQTRLRSVQLAVSVDEHVRTSPTLQAALLTLVNLAPRVFKREILVVDPSGALSARPLIRTTVTTMGAAVAACGGVICRDLNGAIPIVLGGGLSDIGLRLTFDGWSCRVGPAVWSAPLAQRERCVLSGIAGAALALGEVFFQSFALSAEAGERETGLSLWAPNWLPNAPEAVGPRVEVLPGEAWILGLGHLGQGIAWALSMLPFPDPTKMELLLQDFDRVVKGNIGTQALCSERCIQRRKTHVCSEFLRARGFDPGVIDRPFCERSPRTNGEPALALCGFDGAGPREILDQVNFERVVVCGTGGGASDFDELQIHTLPLQDLGARDIWPPVHDRRSREVLATQNPFYRAYREAHHCGELELAGVSVAVPFVGALAGAVAWAEVIRELNGGRRSAFLELPVRCLDERRVRVSAADSTSPRYAWLEAAGSSTVDEPSRLAQFAAVANG